MKTSNRTETLNLVEIARRFPDDATARAFLEKTRWPNGPVCPHCHGVNNASPIAANVAKKIRPGLYTCRTEECGKQFTVTVGTVFEASKVSLSNWLIAWHLMCASKKGIAALELQRLLGIGSYRTAWFMLMRIRESMKSGSFDGSPLKGTVEADAMFIGNKGRRTAKGAHTKKAAVLVMVQREGEARSFVVQGENVASVAPVLAANVDPSAALMTDGAHCYRTPGKLFAGGHHAVDHSRKEYSRGNVNTGSAESLIGLVKRGQYGVFHSISPKYLGRYMVEFDYRFSRRYSSDGGRTLRGLGNMDGKRLKLADLKAAG